MAVKDKPVLTEHIREKLEQITDARRFLIGFSGGADSTALITALQRLRDDLGAPLEAIHFNHGLHEQAQTWQDHCQTYCSKLAVPLTVHQLGLSAEMGNIEAVAREARYSFLEAHLQTGAVYLTAHNQNDQAETLLLNALRGSGVDGLAGIPPVRSLGPGRVARPLLEIPRSVIEAYLVSENVTWVEDLSNTNTNLDRNFLRHRVIPLMESRWPAAVSRLAKSAAHMATAAKALDAMVSEFAQLESHAGMTLPLGALEAGTGEMPALVIRTWLRQHRVPAPPEARLDELIVQLEGAGPENHCEVRWRHYALRQFGEMLHLTRTPDLPPCPEMTWREDPRIYLGPFLGTLCLKGSTPTVPSGWSAGPRSDGAVMRTHAGGPHRKLKKVIQECAIPPWQRDSIPVLYWNGEPAAIGDWVLAPRLQDWLERHSIEFEWEPETPELVETRLRCRATTKARSQA